MDYGLWTMDYGRWTVDCGLWTVDYGLWTMGLALGAGRRARRRSLTSRSAQVSDLALGAGL